MSQSLEDPPVVGGRPGQVAGGDGEAGQLVRAQLTETLDQAGEPVQLGPVHQPVGQGGQLAQVVGAGERGCAVGVGVGHGQLAADHAAAGQVDLGPAAEGAPGRVGVVVAAVQAGSSTVSTRRQSRTVSGRAARSGA
jgi:hypothetical protein